MTQKEINTAQESNVRSQAHTTQGNQSIQIKALTGELAQMQEERDLREDQLQDARKQIDNLTQANADWQDVQTDLIDRLQDAKRCIKIQENEIYSLKKKASISAQAIINVVSAVEQASKDLRSAE